MSKINNRTPNSFAAAVALLDGCDMVKLSSNTRVVASGEDRVEVQLHGTPVVTFCRDGRVILLTGGWRTATTKSRMNAALVGTGYAVKSVCGEWIVAGRTTRCDFVEGHVIDTRFAA